MMIMSGDPSCASSAASSAAGQGRGHQRARRAQLQDHFKATVNALVYWQFFPLFFWRAGWKTSSTVSSEEHEKRSFRPVSNPNLAKKLKSVQGQGQGHQGQRSTKRQLWQDAYQNASSACGRTWPQRRSRGDHVVRSFMQQVR